MDYETRFYAKACLIQGGALLVLAVFSRPVHCGNAILILLGCLSIWSGWKKL